MSSADAYYMYCRYSNREFCDSKMYMMSWFVVEIYYVSLSLKILEKDQKLET